MSFKISLSYRKLNAPKLYQFASFVHHQVSTHTTEFPAPSPTMTDLNDALQELLTDIKNAGDGGRVMREALNVSKATVITKLDRLKNYIVFTADGDRQVAVLSGFPFTKTPSRRTLGDPGTPELAYNGQQGEMLMKIKAVAGAQSYLHQYTADPMLQNESWTSMSCTSASCKIAGLTPGTVYYFRVVAVGTHDQVAYSSIVGKMAV